MPGRFMTETKSGPVEGTLMGDDRYFIVEGHLDNTDLLHTLTTFVTATHALGFVTLDDYINWLGTLDEPPVRSYAKMYLVEDDSDEEIVSWSDDLDIDEDDVTPVTVLQLK